MTTTEVDPKTTYLGQQTAAAPNGERLPKGKDVNLDWLINDLGLLPLEEIQSCAAAAQELGKAMFDEKKDIYSYFKYRNRQYLLLDERKHSFWVRNWNGHWSADFGTGYITQEELSQSEAA